MGCFTKQLRGGDTVPNFGKDCRIGTLVVSMIGALVLPVVLGCNTYDVIPHHLVPDLARGLTFEMVREAPNNYQGQLVAWGGEVLTATRTKGGTRMEVLQLPLNDALHPAEERARSKGRFIALDSKGTITDPAVVEPGTPVTIVGRIGAAQREALQGIDYRYPSLDVLDMTIWDRKVVSGWRRPGAWAGWGYEPRPWTLYRSYRVD